jgi:peptide/nickel transport system ATP-binding protein
MGCDPVATPLAVRRVVGYCPAGSASFWPRLSGRENLACFAALGGLRLGAAALEARLDDVLAQVGVRPDVAHREVRTYSDGETQRLNLARLLLRDAAVWLLDEPTRSPDVDGQAAMWRLIRDVAVARGATVLAATHDLSGVAAVTDRVVALA